MRSDTSASGRFSARRARIGRAAEAIASRREKAGRLALLGRAAAVHRRCSSRRGSRRCSRRWRRPVGACCSWRCFICCRWAGCGGHPGAVRCRCAARRLARGAAGALGGRVGQQSDAARPSGGPGASWPAICRAGAWRLRTRRRPITVSDHAAGARAICVRADGRRAACAAGAGWRRPASRHEHLRDRRHAHRERLAGAQILVSFYLVQRRGLFGGAVRRLARLRGQARLVRPDQPGRGDRSRRGGHLPPRQARGGQLRAEPRRLAGRHGRGLPRAAAAGLAR